ncbi:MAG: zinc-binding dehydrogenase [Planctomycetota bacterium]
MKALVLNEIKTPLELTDRPPLEPAEDEVIVELRAASLNRRDYWITQGLYPGIEPPVILGSDGAGVVTRVGGDAHKHWLGREVILDPGVGWGEQPEVQSSEFQILGSPRDGTFAGEVAAPVSQLHPKPGHLDWLHASALPLAGVTAYRALFTRGGLMSGETVLLTGIGGGVATMAMQFAVAAGAEVWVTSSSQEKIRRAVEKGAKGGFDYSDDGWTRAVLNQGPPPSLIVDGAGGAGYASLLGLVAPGGRIVNYGATAGAPQKLDLFKVFWKQLQLIGTTMGSPRDFAAMLDFVDKHQIRPIIDRAFTLDQGNEALQCMASSPQFGKYVLDINP